MGEIRVIERSLSEAIVVQSAISKIERTNGQARLTSVEQMALARQAKEAEGMTHIRIRGVIS